MIYVVERKHKGNTWAPINQSCFSGDAFLTAPGAKYLLEYMKNSWPKEKYRVQKYKRAK